MRQQIGELTEQLQGATQDEVALALKGLVNGGKVFPPSIKAASPVDEYRFALGGLSKEALRRVYAKLKRGEYPEYNSDFLPIPARMAELVRREQAVIVDDVVRLRGKLDAIEASQRQGDASGTSTDPEARERVKAMLREFRATHAAEKERQKDINAGRIGDASPEQIERWQKIMELPDRASVDFEHHQYRSVIAKRIEAATDASEDKEAAEWTE